MQKFILLALIALSSLSAYAQTEQQQSALSTKRDTTATDSADYWRKLDLNEVIVIAEKTVIDHKPDRIVYYTKNDPYAKGLNGVEVMRRLPRVSVVDEAVSVAGKANVRYIIDGRLLETSENETLMKLKSLRADNIERIELFTLAPAKYPAADNVCYIAIKTKRDETLGVSGNVDANLIAKESLNSYWGGGIRQATKHVDYSIDLNFNQNKGINDIEREYVFTGHTKLSQRRNDFINKLFNLNALFKFRPTTAIETGVMLNLGTERLKSELQDLTTDRGLSYHSLAHSPSNPINATTLTGYADWNIDDKGKLLSLTYNFFNKTTKSASQINTTEGASSSMMNNSGNNRYKIHALKLDATLPFNAINIEMGAAYTAITNTSAISTEIFSGGVWTIQPGQNNDFRYTEKTSAAYLSLSKEFNPQWYVQAGLRFEHTQLTGTNAAEQNRQSYNRLFPTLNLNYRSNAGYSLSAAYSMGINRPRFIDLNPFRYYTTTTDYVSGNAYLSASLTHNAELSFSHKGLYAVAYAYHLQDGVGYITRFNPDNSQYTTPQNCIDYHKYGVYASYQKNITTWWNVKVGGELFLAKSKSNTVDSQPFNNTSWSGKLEATSDIAFNRQRTLLFTTQYMHLFPHDEDLVRYKTLCLLNTSLRWQIINGRLHLAIAANDPFSQNITRTSKRYSTFYEYTKTNVHARNVSFKITYLFGGKKVREVYKDSKETESNRSY